jgi:hypothetical protein
VALYGAELWWHGQKERQRELQLLINQQARRITGAFRTTLVGPPLKEEGLEPAETTLVKTVGVYDTTIRITERNILSITFREGQSRNW